MATRKKVDRKKVGRKKATKKKATRKKAAGKKTARKKATRKKATRKKAKPAAKKATRQKSARKAAPRRKPAAPAEAPEVAIARQIVAAASDPSFRFEDLYTPDCVSVEGNGMRVEGYAGLREKSAGWGASLESSTWEARHVFTRPGAIAIEWDAQIKFKDGRNVHMQELAVHELRAGKIAAERYYYDPAAIAPPPPEEPREPYTPSDIKPSSSDSGIDPMDL